MFLLNMLCFCDTGSNAKELNISQPLRFHSFMFINNISVTWGLDGRIKVFKCCMMMCDVCYT